MRLTGTLKARSLERQQDLQVNAARARVDRQRAAEGVDARPEAHGPYAPGRERGMLPAPAEGEAPAVVHDLEAHGPVPGADAHLHRLGAAVARRIDDGLVDHQADVLRELPGEPAER